LQAKVTGGLSEDSDAYQEQLEAAIREIKAETTAESVVIYTYEWSPFSSETKALLDRLNVKYNEISLGKEWIPGLIGPDGSIKRVALLEMTGQSSLPHVFVGGKAIGGLFGGEPGLVPALENGDLLDMLKEAQTSKSSKTSGIFE
jgi:glutaredoxin 3